MADVLGARKEEGDETYRTQVARQQNQTENTTYDPREHANMVADLCHLLSVANVTIITYWMIRKSKV